MPGRSKVDFALACIVVMTLVFLTVPLLMIVVLSFSGSGGLNFPPGSFTLDLFREVIGDPRWLKATLVSTSVALLSMLIAVFAGTILSIVMWASRTRNARVFEMLAVSPASMPLVVLAVGLFLTLASFDMIDTIPGLALGHAVISVPFVYFVISAALQQFDASIMEAALIHGAHRFRAHWTVLVPYLRPAILVSAILSFLTSFDEVVLAIFIGLSDTVTLPNLIWRSLQFEADPVVTAVASLVLVGGVLLQIVAFLVFLRSLRNKGPRVRSLS